MKTFGREDLNKAQFGIEEQLFLTIQSLKERKSAQLFIEPVNDDELPDYYETISNPIDLLTIQDKLKKGKYNYCKQVKSDLILIIQNSKKYNYLNESILKITNKFASCINTEWKIFLATLSKKELHKNTKLSLSGKVLQRISKIEEKKNKIKVFNLNLRNKGQLNKNENIYYSTLSAINTIEQTKSENCFEELQIKNIIIKNQSQDDYQKNKMIVLDQKQINECFRQMSRKKIKKYKNILNKKLNWLRQNIVYKMMKSQKYQHLVVLPYLDKHILSILRSQTLQIKQLQAIIKQMAYFVEGYKHVLSDRMKQKFIINCSEFRRCLLRILKYMQIHDVLDNLQNSIIQNQVEAKSEVEENKQSKISKNLGCSVLLKCQRKYKYIMSDFKKLFQKDKIREVKNQPKIKLNIQQNDGSILLNNGYQNFNEIKNNQYKHVSKNKCFNLFRFDIPKENDEKILQQQLEEAKIKDKMFIEQYKIRSNIKIILKFFKQGFDINWQKAVEVKKQSNKPIEFYISK